ncbi:hypothetical protein A2U01_0057410, partial [Trifolium medium]|nr:hypothetical protein [Trifolium medium]
QQRLGRKQTFIPSNRIPVNQWRHGQHATSDKKVMEKGNASRINQTNVAEASKYFYRNNYKSKNPMTRMQWRRFQCQKQMANQKAQTGGKAKNDKKVEAARRPAKERISPSDA